MYEKHFGLKTKPFSSNAEGPAVFVGPQQARAMKSLKKGLNAVDAIVAVTGPVGVGKTTIVTRALESLSPGRMVAWVGRMSLAPDEVLELLLAGFGISRQAKGTIQRFAAFRRLLGERAKAGAQVAIVVEDAQRIGPDALVELEALTAADSGDSTGANIILMGQPELNEWLATPELARLRQRTRLRHTVDPFNAPEVQGYLRHSIRAAGGDFDTIFDSGAVDMLCRASEGIPRVINNLCESALTLAAEEGVGPLTAEFIQRVARDALGIDLDLSAPAEAPGIATEPDLERAITPDASFDVEDVVAEAPPAPEPEPEPVPEPEPEPEPDIPELIQDTHPAIKALDPLPELATDENPDIESTQTQKKPEWAVDQPGLGVAGDDDDEEIPAELNFEIESTSRMPAINADDIVQADKAKLEEDSEPTQKFKMAPMITVDRNTKVDLDPGPAEIDDEELPTLCESMRIDAPKPASARQMAATEAQAEPELVPEPEPDPVPEPEPEPEPMAEADPEPEPEPGPEPIALAEPAAATSDTPRMPDIDALEAAIEAAHKGDTGNLPIVSDSSVDNASAETDGTAVGIPALTLDQSLEEKRGKADIPEELADGLSKAASIDDLSDKMAETLFGDEAFDAIAAEVVANPPPGMAAPGEINEEASPVMLDVEVTAETADGTKPELPVLTETGQKEMGYTGEFNMSVTRRLEMVNALNKGESAANGENIELGDSKATDQAPKPGGPQPEPIKEQINTSMTATLKALSSANAPPPPVENDEPEDKKSTGLFSKFKRS